MNNLESDGYNAIMDLVRLSNDPADPWGSNIGWLYALADYALVIDGAALRGYRPSLMEVDLGDVSSELEELFEINESFEPEDITRAYMVLSRRDDWLRLDGRNY